MGSIIFKQFVFKQDLFFIFANGGGWAGSQNLIIFCGHQKLMNPRNKQTFVRRSLCFYKSIWEQNYIATDIYTKNHYTNVFKCIEMTSNSKHKAERKHGKHRKIKFSPFSQRNMCKMQTYINQFEQNNDYKWIMDTRKFHCSFKLLTVM